MFAGNSASCHHCRRGSRAERCGAHIVFASGLVWLVLSGSVPAQPYRPLAPRGPRGPAETPQIEQAVQEILEQPEFRYFQRLQPDLEQLRAGSGADLTGWPGGRGGPGRAGQWQPGDDGPWPDDGEWRERAERGAQPPADGRPDADRNWPPQDAERGPGGRDAGRAGQPDGADGRANPMERLFRDAERRRESREATARDAEPRGSGAVGSAFGTLYTGLAWTLIAVVCGAILFLIVRAIARMEPAESSHGATGPVDALEGELERHAAPGATPADVYLEQARQLAAEGQYQQACAQLLLGAMSQIERAGKLRYRQGVTLRDYERAVRSDATQYRAIRELVRIYEPLGFGRRSATRRHFQLSLAGYEAGFHASTTALGD